MGFNKKQIIDAFREISSLEENQFKSRAYLRAIQHLESMTQEEFDSRKTFLNLPGIGMSLNSKLLEFKQTGNLPAKLFKLREDNKSYLDPQLYKVRKGFITKRIPHAEAAVFMQSLEEYLDFHGEIKVYSLGSFRRQKPLVADLDILVVGEENYIKAVELLKELSDVTPLQGGPAKHSFMLNNAEKTSIDLTWCDERTLPFSILHFTGSAASNIRMRAHAQSLGYKLNQYGIFNESDGLLVTDREFKTEEDIFEFLGLPYVEPKNR